MSTAAAVSNSAIPGGGEYWHLHLYVAGQSANSVRALANLRELCEEHMRGHYQIEVRDLADDPVLARSEEILAIPTLVRHLPQPARRIIGDFSDNDRVLAQLRPREKRLPQESERETTRPSPVEPRVSTRALQERIEELKAANEQLSGELRTTKIAEQATGAISVRYGMPPGDSFKLLSGMASGQKRSLDDLAEETLNNRGRFARPSTR
ncbi:MAG: circadian clock protein KaiB [Gaiellaceae bacterium]|nr:circadian clock protein KaiB [Gaiellaceae bacterium]